MSEVVKFTGSSAAPSGTICREIVSVLEGLLDQAKAGEIIGLAYAGVRPNGDATFGFDGWDRISVIGAVTIMQKEAVESIMGDA